MYSSISVSHLGAEECLEAEKPGEPRSSREKIIVFPVAVKAVFPNKS